MNRMATAKRRIDSAGELTQILDAAYVGFMTMLAGIEDQQDPASPYFVTFVMAGPPAAAGRFAVLAAPSLSPAIRSIGFLKDATPLASPEEAAAAIAQLSQAIATRLHDVALVAADADDRMACAKGAWHARELCARFGLAEPP